MTLKPINRFARIIATCALLLGVNLLVACGAGETPERYDTALRADAIEYPQNENEETPVTSALDLAVLDSRGYFPGHDATVVRFADDHPIKVFAELNQVDLGGRSVYPARVRNHDHAWLPLEPVFEASGIEFRWDEGEGVLHISNPQHEIVIRPEVDGFRVNFSGMPHGVYDYWWEPDYDDPSWTNFIDHDVPRMVEQRSSGLYVHSGIFDWISRVTADTAMTNWPSIYQPWFALIYHDLHKIVILEQGSGFDSVLFSPYFQDKRFEARHHFDRADFPLDEMEIVLWDVNRFREAAFAVDSLDLEPYEIVFDSAEPFIISTKYEDYVMVPAVEMFEILGAISRVDGDSVHVALVEGGREHVLVDGEPLGLYTYFMNMRHEIAPMLVDGVMFISHVDIHRMYTEPSQDQLRVIVGLNRANSMLIFNLIRNDFYLVPNSRSPASPSPGTMYP